MSNRPHLHALIRSALLAAVLAGCGGGGAGEPAGADAGFRDVEVTCTPGRRFCLESGVSAVCGAGGDSVSAVVHCASGLVCDGALGQCQLPVCTPGEARCADDDHYRICAEDGAGWVGAPVACPDDRRCVDGDCRRCVPGAVACDGEQTIVRCDAQGETWSVQETCGSGERCHEPSGTCVSEACGGGSALCTSSTTYRLCRGPAEGWSEELHPCGVKELCVDGACVPCEDGPARCTSTWGMEVCDAEAGGYAETTCPLVTPCSGDPAGCRLPEPPFCIPGRPDCVDALSRQVCADDGRSWEEGVEGCPVGTVCNFGHCVDESCMGRLMLLIDRSASMADRWPDVYVATWRVLDAHLNVRYGLTFYPRQLDDLKAPSFPTLPIGHFNNVSVMAAVFAANPPRGPSPLLEVLGRMVESPETYFGDPGVHLVILTDGRPGCDGPAASCADDLGKLVSRLHDRHGVTTWPIGFGYDADPANLQAVAEYGGSPWDTWVPADDGEELEAAMATILEQAAGCDEPTLVERWNARRP
ncbi:MAG: vWA domain-containing protein [Myxococcota bacterium]